MRARIRALSAVLAILGLVAPTGAVAQDPPTAEVAAAQARTAVPPGGNLPLSLDEAVARALENNVDIAVERYNPELSAQDVLSAQGYYDPFLFANLSKTSTDTKGTNFFSGGDAVNTKTGLWNFGLGIPIQTGGEFSLAFNNNKRPSVFDWTARRGVVERITTNKANAVVLWDGRKSTEVVPIRSVELEPELGLPQTVHRL